MQDADGDVVDGPYEFPDRRRFHFTDPSGNGQGVWAIVRYAPLYELPQLGVLS